MIEITDQPIHIEDQKAHLMNAKAGALVEFEGLVRNHNEGEAVSALEYEAYEPLCVIEGMKILAEAREKYQVYDVRCIHRTGLLQIGDLAVWVGATAAHRGAAFQACQYVIDQLKVRLPIWKKEHYVDRDSQWVNCQRCAQHAHGHSHGTGPFSNAEYFKSQRALSQFSKEAFDQLQGSRVLVVGSGGLGCPALTVLATNGVGHIGIADGDIVELSNLHRQNLFSINDIGQNKARQASLRLKQLNPSVKIDANEEYLDFENVNRIVKNYDLVIDCTDNFRAKYLVHDTCFFQNKPLIQASVYQWEGSIQIFADWSEGCVRCQWSEMPDLSCQGSCQEVGVMSTAPIMLGTLQANEAIKLLTNSGSSLKSRSLFVDLLTNEFHKIRRPRNPQCPLCGDVPRIAQMSPDLYQQSKEHNWEIEISVNEVSDLNSSFVCMDLRAESEIPDEYRRRGLHSFSLEEIDVQIRTNKKKIVVTCAQGIRSRRLVKKYRDQGYENVFSLKGGTNLFSSSFHNGNM
ncbi:MAG: ThiF family adenylyltransferase [Bdellovibrionales bacterium]|nr:ThiF family adenylyltransferase [Bdellovibrionales bacterium]